MKRQMKKFLGRFGLDLHTQNLNAKPGDESHAPSGSALRHGRLWVRDAITADTKFAMEWVMELRMPGFGLTLDAMDMEIALRLEGPVLGCLFISVPFDSLGIAKKALIVGQHLASVADYESIDVIDASFHHNMFWWRLVHPTDSWKNGTPWWRYGSINFEDLILGEATVEDKLVGPKHDVEIPMPEGTYRWTAQMKQRTVRRRWTSDTFTSAQLECQEGQEIPFPGKGTASWNCGSDATYSLSAPADSVEHAIGKLVSSILRDRKRRCGSHTYVTGGVYDKKKAG